MTIVTGFPAARFFVVIIWLRFRPNLSVNNLNLLCLRSLVHVEVREGYFHQPEEFINSQEVSVEHREHNLGSVALIGDGPVNE